MGFPALGRFETASGSKRVIGNIVRLHSKRDSTWIITFYDLVSSLYAHWRYCFDIVWRILAPFLDLMDGGLLPWCFGSDRFIAQLSYKSKLLLFLL